ncbi:Ig-like domain-containing protein, partial [Brevibacterium casei]
DADADGEEPDPTDPPDQDGYDPADPGEEPPTEPGDPEHPKETGHKYPKDNSDAVDLKPAIPEDHYDQSSLALIDPTTGTPTRLIVLDVGTFTIRGDGQINFTPYAPFDGSVTIKYTVLDNDGNWVAGRVTITGGGTIDNPADSNATTDDTGSSESNAADTANS